MKPLLYLLCCLALLSTVLCRTTPAQTQNDQESSKPIKDQLFEALDEDVVDPDLVRKLLDKDPTLVRARNEDSDTPLHVVADKEEAEQLITLFLSKGADVKAVNREGQTTVDMANGPVQRTQPFPETIKLLEGLGAINNHKCVSC